jgi:hypothetical protein
MDMGMAKPAAAQSQIAEAMAAADSLRRRRTEGGSGRRRLTSWDGGRRATEARGQLAAATSHNYSGRLAKQRISTGINHVIRLRSDRNKHDLMESFNSAIRLLAKTGGTVLFSVDMNGPRCLFLLICVG